LTGIALQSPEVKGHVYFWNSCLSSADFNLFGGKGGGGLSV